MKKASRIKFNVTSLALLFTFIMALLIGNVFHAGIGVATIPGSYADSYAKKKHLTKLEMADSEKEYFNLKYETFEFNLNSGGSITLVKYNGESEVLVLPESIEGFRVSAIGADFFESAKQVKTMYLPLSIERIELKEDEDKNPIIPDIEIRCFDVTPFYVNNPDTKLHVKVLNHSQYVDFTLGDCPFRYNDLGNAIELVRYIGDDEDLIVIPSYINGKPVTTVSFDMLGKYNAVIFPETVTAINGRTYITTVSVKWAVAMFFALVAFLASIITMNIVLPRFRNDNEVIYSAPIVIVTYLYLIAQLVFSCVAIYRNVINLFIVFVVGFGLLAGFIIFVGLAGGGRKQAIVAEQHIIEKTETVRSLKSAAIGLSNGISDPELKKKIQRMEEEIKYMPKNSKNSESEEKATLLMHELREAIKGNDISGAAEKCDCIMDLLTRR